MKILALLFGIVVSLTALAETKEYKVGVDYDVISKDSYYKKSSKIEINQLFWYGCPHCFAFEPEFAKFKETLKGDLYDFTSMPVPGASDDSLWTLHARLFYTLEKMNLLAKLHKDVFDEYHVNKNRLATPEAMAEFLASKGVNKDEFKKMYSSSEVSTLVNNAKTYVKNNNISGVPAVVIDRQYLVSAAKFKSLTDMVNAINFLVEKVKKDNKIK